jgi:O-antigen ligase
MRLFLLLVFLAALLSHLTSNDRKKNIAIFLIIFGALLSFYSILQRVEDPDSIYGLRQPDQAIPFGTYVNRHHFAALMEMIFGLTLGLLLFGGLKRSRWPFLLAAGVSMAIAVILTGSRGGLIGLFSAMATLATARFYTRKELTGSRLTPPLLLAAGLLFVMFIGGLVIYIGGTDPLLRSTGVSIGVEDFTTGRKDFWLTALRIFKDHPIAGVGMDAFGAAYSIYDKSSGMFRVEQAHNDYLQMLADGGVIGFAIIVSFVYLFVRKSLRTIRQASESHSKGIAVGAFAGCVAMLVHSFFDFPLRTPANSFVFLTLAALAVTQVPELKRKRSRDKLPHGN